MSEGPIRIGSFTFYQIVVFLIVFVWSVIGFQVAQFQLLTLFETPLNWVAWAVFTLVSLIPAIAAVTWRMKTQIIYVEPEWDFREREVSLSEYEQMMEQYRSEYRNYLSFIDYTLVFLACILSISSVVFPFLTMGTTFLLIAATPVIFGFLILIYGLVVSSILFKFIPNEATPHFSIVSEKLFRQSINMMLATPGISWAGISLTLGEASGFYTVRHAKPVARIEGIESAAKIQSVLDETRQISKMVSTLTLDDSETQVVTSETSGTVSPKSITELVQKTLIAYIQAKGEDEILEEVLEEVRFFMKRFSDGDKSSTS